MPNLTVCPHCGGALDSIVDGRFKKSLAQKEKIGAATTQRWAHLRQLEANLRAAGKIVRPGELTNHSSRYYFARLLVAYNRRRWKNGLMRITMAQFDPWGAHADAELDVAAVYDPTDPSARDQAERLFGVVEVTA